MHEQEHKAETNLAQVLQEQERLSHLTNRGLVEEVLRLDGGIADHLAVIEMMNRLDPQWTASMRLTE